MARLWRTTTLRDSHSQIRSGNLVMSVGLMYKNKVSIIMNCIGGLYNWKNTKKPINANGRSAAWVKLHP